MNEKLHPFLPPYRESSAINHHALSALSFSAWTWLLKTSAHSNEDYKAQLKGERCEGWCHFGVWRPTFLIFVFFWAMFQAGLPTLSGKRRCLLSIYINAAVLTETGYFVSTVITRLTTFIERTCNARVLDLISKFKYLALSLEFCADIRQTDDWGGFVYIGWFLRIRE